MLTFDPNIYLKQIIVVGLGGTGSQVARSICRMIYDMQQRRFQTPEIIFVDPDTVERKNVGRQMFTPADIGNYKAELLARRFNVALGLQIKAYAAPFDYRAHLGTGFYDRSYSLIVGCVDNHEARLAIRQASSLTLDCGNHYDSGQVVLGNIHADWDRLQPRDGVLNNAPSAYMLFPELLEPEPIREEPILSCADLVQQGDQHILINEFVALAAAGMVYRLLHRQPLTSTMALVNAKLGSMDSVPLADMLETYKETTP